MRLASSFDCGRQWDLIIVVDVTSMCLNLKASYFCLSRCAGEKCETRDCTAQRDWVREERRKKCKKIQNKAKIGNKFYYVGIWRCCLNYFGISGISVGQNNMWNFNWIILAFEGKRNIFFFGWGRGPKKTEIKAPNEHDLWLPFEKAQSNARSRNNCE